MLTSAITYLIILLKLSISNGQGSKHPKIIIIGYDGFRYDYVDLFPAPAFKSLRDAGPKVPYMESVFPTYTYPNLHTFATGLYPDSHGILYNRYFDRDTKRELSAYKADDVEVWNYRSDVLPIWVLNEMEGDGRHSGCIAWPGCTAPYGENHDLIPTYVSNKVQKWENRVDLMLSWMTDKKRPANIVFIFSAEPDAQADKDGFLSNGTIESFKKVDTQADYLIKGLKEKKLFDKVNIIIVSDHGISGEKANYLIDMVWMLKQNLAYSTIGHGPFLNVVAKPGKYDELYEKLIELAKSHNDKFAVMKKGEMDGYPYFFKSSERLPDFVLLGVPGTMFDYPVPHGYTPLDPEMRNIFIGSGPAFKEASGFGPIMATDIAPMMSMILKIKMLPHNGSLERFKGMLNE